MENFELAIYGVQIASEILGINMPEVRFFIHREVHCEDINAVFVRRNNTIGFNEAWLESAEQLEIIVTCFHEARHAFQNEVINQTYQGEIKIDLDKKELWEKEIKVYQSKLNNFSDKEYLLQDLEIDAVAFSHLMMLKYFEVKTVIPEEIKDQVNIKLAELEQSNFKIYQINDDKK